MIYGEPGLLAVVWFGSSPTPSPSLVIMLDRQHTGRLRKRDNVLTGDVGRGWARSHIIRSQESLALYKLYSTLCSPYFREPFFTAGAESSIVAGAKLRDPPP
jgi:hypothetical protein